MSTLQTRTRFSEPHSKSRLVKDIAPILDHGRWTGYQKLVLLLVSLVAMLDGLDSRVLALSLPSIVREWGVARSAFVPIFAGSFIAMALGALVGGVAGDRIGRRWTLIGSVTAFGATTLVGAYAHDLWSLSVWRILASAGLGAAMPNITTLLAEYTPIKRRSVALSVCISALIVGKVGAGLLGARLLPHAGWRALFVASGLLPLALAAVLWVILPESLRFLAARKPDSATARRLLRRLGHTLVPGARLVDNGPLVTAVPRASIRSLVSGEYGRDTLWLSLSFFAIFLSTYTVSTWLPSLLTDAGYSLAMASASTSVFGLGGLICGIGGAWTFSRLGSRVPLMTLAIGAAVTTLALSTVSFAPEGGTRWASTLGIFLVGAIPGVQVAIFVLAAEMFPTTVRATGVGVATAFGRLGAVFSAFVGPPLLAVGAHAYFGFLTATMTVAALSLALIRRHVARGFVARQQQPIDASPAGG
ncbi:MFS transporter [Paraburkholderia megapolitana]|uniref:MFS transporter n=1 Tax=Paraburkholderia megapolitana TaxID=420953 RepID=UPI0038B883EB